MMKPHTNCMTLSTPIVNETGMGLLEVLIAIMIFAIGMIALVNFQANLARSSSDANTRTVAASIAEESIEDMRSFEVIESEAGKKAYDDIVSVNTVVSRAGIDYTVGIDVQDYYVLADRNSVSTIPPVGATSSSFKRATVTVAWTAGPEFVIDESQSTSGQLGSGSVVISTAIASLNSLNNAHVAAGDDGELGTPPVFYVPSQQPETVAIELGTYRFKESTTPLPIVRRKDELIETWFDVITYSTAGADAVFLRREEFASISCACTLRAASGSGKDGRTPAIWTGAEYAGALEVGKQYGEGASNQQSQYCDVCCKDHHDTASGPNSFRPWASSFSGNHDHYSRNNFGVLSVVAVDEDYIEACRLIRRDGFFRVAQDFNLQNQIVFPENYMNVSSELDAYSNYVSTAVIDHFENGTSPLMTHSLPFEGITFANPSPLPTASLAMSQQLRSRGVYTDLIGSALADNIYNCFDLAGDPSLCEAPDALSALELYPFFDVQLTMLTRWSETEPDEPVDVSDDEIAANGYSRGVAKLTGNELGASYVHSKIETGNTGLISIASVTLDPPETFSESNLLIVAGGDDSIPPPSGRQVVSGTVTNAKRTSSAVASVKGLGAKCSRPTNTTFRCSIDPNAAIHRLIVSNYYNKNAPLVACSSQLTTISVAYGSSLTTNTTTFSLPTSDLSGVVIVISRAPC